VPKQSAKAQSVIFEKHSEKAERGDTKRSPLKLPSQKFDFRKMKVGAKKERQAAWIETGMQSHTRSVGEKRRKKDRGGHSKDLGKEIVKLAQLEAWKRADLEKKVRRRK